jgi:hypothetical protein
VALAATIGAGAVLGGNRLAPPTRGETGTEGDQRREERGNDEAEGTPWDAETGGGRTRDPHDPEGRQGRGSDGAPTAATGGQQCVEPRPGSHRTAL